MCLLCFSSFIFLTFFLNSKTLHIRVGNLQQNFSNVVVSVTLEVTYILILNNIETKNTGILTSLLLLNKIHMRMH